MAEVRASVNSNVNKDIESRPDSVTLRNNKGIVKHSRTPTVTANMQKERNGKRSQLSRTENPARQSVDRPRGFHVYFGFGQLKRQGSRIMPSTIEWAKVALLELIDERPVGMFWIRRVAVYGHHHPALRDALSWSVKAIKL